MADEINVQFDLAGPPSSVMQEWRAAPPPALSPDADFELVDESFNSLTYERRYLDWPQKFIVYTTLFLIPFRSWFMSVFRATVRFGEEQEHTRVTIAGTVHPKTRAALHELIVEHGGQVGTTPTKSATSTLLPGSPPS